MGERGEVEIAAEFLVCADQHVEIEARGYPGGVVIGVNQHAFVLFEIDADDHLRAAPENLARAAQKAAGFMRLEISQRRTGEKSDLRHRLYRRGQRERRGEICGDRIDVQTGKVV